MLFQLVFIYLLITVGVLANAQPDTLVPMPRYPPHLVARQIPGPPQGARNPLLKPPQRPNRSGGGESSGEAGSETGDDSRKGSENGGDDAGGDGTDFNGMNGSDGGDGGHTCERECLHNDDDCRQCDGWQDFSPVEATMGDGRRKKSPGLKWVVAKLFQ
ncbi:MAG: hypothetical protein Q9165_001972 [Trypethelium subeluteriae]